LLPSVSEEIVCGMGRSKMKWLLALLATMLLSGVVTACGGAGKSTSSASQASSTTAASGSTSATSAPGSYRQDDGDKDNDDSAQPSASLNDDTPLLKAYGKAGSEADKQAVTEVVKSYYAAAVAENGAKACSLLYSTLASGLAVDPGQAGQGKGGTCATAVSALYKSQHAQLVADDVPTMVVTTVRVKGSLGLAVLGFKTMPRSEILLEREGGAWKVDALFNSQMP
jgi:hypothetical protein